MRGTGRDLRARLVKAMELQQAPNPAERSLLPVRVVGHTTLTPRAGVKMREGRHTEVPGERESAVQTQELSRTSPSLWDPSKGVRRPKEKKTPGSSGSRDPGLDSTSLGLLPKPFCLQQPSASGAQRTHQPCTLCQARCARLFIDELRSPHSEPMREVLLLYAFYG